MRSSTESGKYFNLKISGRKVKGIGDHYELREQGDAYNAHFEPKNRRLSIEMHYICESMPNNQEDSLVRL